MKITLTRTNDAVGLLAKNEAGNALQLDGSSEIGGQNLGLRPMETLLAALVSCTSIDVLVIMQKKRIVLQKFEVSVEGKRKNTIPSSFEKIHLVFGIDPNDPLEQVVYAVSLSIEKYCSVAASLSAEIEITHEVRTI